MVQVSVLRVHSFKRTESLVVPYVKLLYVNQHKMFSRESCWWQCYKNGYWKASSLKSGWCNDRDASWPVASHGRWGRVQEPGDDVCAQLETDLLCVESSAYMLAVMKILQTSLKPTKPLTNSLVHWSLERSARCMQTPVQMRGGTKAVMGLKHLRWTFSEATE